MKPRIPGETPPAKSPSALTQLEVADLPPARRLTVLEERWRAELQERVGRLSDENRQLVMTLAELRDRSSSQAVSLTSLQHHNDDLRISVFLVTVASAIGGGLISSYPLTPTQVPWQFVLGWSLIGIGTVFTAAQWVGVHLLQWIRGKLRAAGHS